MYTWKSQRKPRVYVTVSQKTAYRKKKCINSRQTDRLRQTSHQSDSTRNTCPQTRHRNKKEQFKYIECREINPQRKTTRNSPAESPTLLRREIPMAWGTTTDSLTPEINPFQYAIEIKCLTLKDQTSYLIRLK